MDFEIRPPREAAIRILARLFTDPEPGGRPRTFPLAGFQEAAVSRAQRTLERWGGVLVADDVGLGKTFIGLALAEDAMARGGRVLVAVPAAVRPIWHRPLRQLSALTGRGTVELLSHAQLSRGSYSPALPGCLDLLVVDEAHRFRNPRARRHAALVELASGAQVVLLTATPVNNRLEDLHALVRLFARDDAFLEIGIPGLRDLLARPESELDRPALGRLLQEILIRRTRSMVPRFRVPAMAPDGRAAGEDNGGHGLPRRLPPNLVRYHDPGIPALSAEIADLELAVYAVATRTPPPGPAALVRLGLLKRLESGRAAFGRSVQRQLRFLHAFLAALDDGLLVRPRGPAGGSADYDPLQLVLLPLVSEPWPAELPPRPVRRSVRRDVDRLEGILRRLEGEDPKLAALGRLVARIAHDRVIVFTEFRETAESVWRALSPAFRTGRIDGAGAWLGARPAGRRAVIERFAPRANGAPTPPGRERVDVLVATDVVAEGMNLQDARHVVNYDLPWNPVRLLQRVGRVDRLGAAHETVQPHLFLPATGLEDLLGLTRRLRAKLGDIAVVAGGEDVRELLARLDRSDPREAARILDRVQDREAMAMERVRALWERTTVADGAREEPGLEHAGPAGSPGILLTTVAHDGESAGAAWPHALVLARTRQSVALLEVGPDGAVGPPGPGAADLMERAMEDGPAAHAPAHLHRARRVADLALEHLRAVDVTAVAPGVVRAADPGARVARVLRTTMAKRMDSVQPGTVERADRVLQTLASPLHPGADAAIRRLASQTEAADSVPDLVDRIERALQHHPNGGSPQPHGEARKSRILAIMLAQDAARRSVDDPEGHG